VTVSPRGLTGKTAIITGGARSIGAEVVRAFHAAGSRVMIADIADDEGHALAAELGAGVEFQSTDLAADADVQRLVTRTVDWFGGIYFQVNVACSYVDEGFASSRSEWAESFDINVVGGVMLLQAAQPFLAKSSGAAVVNFSSISGRIAQTGRWLYPVSKAAIAELTRCEAMDLASDGIRVNSVSPGWIWSRVMDEGTGGNRKKVDEVAAPYHLLGRAGDPQEVAQTVLFLCSADASFITGTDIAVDGGYSAMGPEQAVPALPKLFE